MDFVYSVFQFSLHSEFPKVTYIWLANNSPVAQLVEHMFVSLVTFNLRSVV